MDGIVLQIVHEIAWAHVGFHPTIFTIPLGISRQWRWLALAQENKDQPKVFHRRTTSNANLLGKSFFLRRLLDALAGTVEFPAVITTANAVVFDPTQRKLS